MHTVYLPDSDDWSLFFEEQTGGANPYFEGDLYRRGFQVGSGIGGIMASLLPYIIPIARRLGKESMSFGSRVLNQLSQDEPLKETLKKEGVQSIKNIAASGFKQTGNGRKKRQKNHSIVGKRLKTAASFNFSPIKDPFEN